MQVNVTLLSPSRAKIEHGRKVYYVKTLAEPSEDWSPWAGTGSPGRFIVDDGERKVEYEAATNVDALMTHLGAPA